MSVLKRWVSARDARLGLDYLLIAPGPQSSVVERAQWLEELVAFIRQAPRSRMPKGAGAEGGPINRMRALLTLLERSPERAAAIGAALAQLLAELDSVDLFCSAGMSGDMGFTAELIERMWAKVLQRHREPQDLGDVVHRLFPVEADSAWLLELTASDVQRMRTLLGAAAPSVWERDLREALAVLGSKARVIASYEELRLRLPSRRPSQSAFFALDATATRLARDEGLTPQILDEIATLTMRCDSELAHLRATLQTHGSNFSITYQVHRLRSIVARIRMLTAYAKEAPRDLLAAPKLLARLAGEAARLHRIRPLWSEVSQTVAHRIADANAETGEHYITRDRSGYKSVLLAALGGGGITVATVFGKILVDQTALEPLAKGLCASVIYALSFLLIQGLGLTLATKQPSMTAASLARTLDGPEGPGRIVAFAKELVHLVRTQMAAICGNLLGVVSGITIVWLALTRGLGWSLIDREYARYTLESHSLLGWTPLFAALTGLALWASSILTGWVANSIRLRRLPETIANHRRLRFAFGQRRASQVGEAANDGIPAAFGNAGLGLLLGFVPKVAGAFGIPLEGRHITLASGALALAVLSGGTEGMTRGDLALTVLGVASIGLLNLGVSFGLAIVVAMRARDVAPAQRTMIRKAIWAQVVKRPIGLVWP